MGKKTILLVRHGQYNKAGVGPEHLTALGRKQASLIGKRLKEYKISKVVVSSMPRALETAEIILSNINYKKKNQVTELLRECRPHLHLSRMTEVKNINKRDMDLNTKTLNKAFECFFRSSSKSEVVLLVCHGNVIRYLTCKALGIDPRCWISLDITQGSLTTIEVHKNKKYPYVIMGFNDVGHLPLKMRTYL